MSHRGYLIRQIGLDPRDGYWVWKDDIRICWAKTVDEAKRKVNELLDGIPESTKVQKGKAPKRKV